MANVLLTGTPITKESLRVLVNNFRFTMAVNRTYKNEFKEGKGTTVDVRKPPRYTVSIGQAITPQDTAETSVPVKLDKQWNVALGFSSEDLTLNIAAFSDRIIKPAAAALANKIDMDGLGLYVEVPNFVGAPGTVPNSSQTYLDGGALLDDEATPQDDLRTMIVTPSMQATIVNALQGLHQSSGELDKQYRKGRMFNALGFDWFMSQNARMHTVGPLGGTPLVNGGGQTGSSLITDGWTAAAANRLKRGDVITLGSVFAVNPQTRESTGNLRNFVVTADVDSDGAGAATIPIYPAITPTGASQTVDASPADNAVIKIFGHASSYASKNSRQGVGFHRDAFAFACADLLIPNDVDMSGRVASKELGLSLRLLRQYTINDDKLVCRLDVLGGWKSLYPELAVRVVS